MGAEVRVHPRNPGISAAPPLVGHGPGRIVLAVLATAVLAGALLAPLRVHDFASSRDTPSPIWPPSPLRALSDLRPVEITITTPEWTKVREVVTVDRLRTDHTLWRQMHFGDWDGVPRAMREPALLAMTRAYAGALEGPRTWRRMSAAEWDVVPQPIRAIAYLRMIWFWAATEELGAEFGLAPEALAQTVGAIVMAESWFEHRALNENAWGNRDLGLAQCSDHCRAVLAEMALSGDIAFAPTERDYFNPWASTRIATVWFERELLRAQGDVDLATRAYHRGLDAAMDERGDAYVARVHRLRDRYIRTQGPSPSWRFLVRTIRDSHWLTQYSGRLGPSAQPNQHRVPRDI